MSYVGIHPFGNSYYEAPEDAVFREPRGSGPELSDIVKRYLADYCAGHRISAEQRRMLQAIANCRSRALGAHIRKCEEEGCGYVEIAYNSCRNRHCPKCQGSQRVKWVARQVEELLPVAYYHVVFTLPHELNDLCLCNKAVVYDLLFKAAAETLQEFGRDEKHLGAELGFSAILHSWGQSLCYHVHLHLIVSGGGLVGEGRQWKHLPYRKEFLFPAKALSQVMRGKLKEKLRAAYRRGELEFPGRLEAIRGAKEFEEFVSGLSRKAFVIYSKKPFGGPEEVVEYIGNYSHKVAISNQRLLDIEDGQICFRYRDYKDERKQKVMQLSAEEFLRRFLLHSLPEGFKRIRHYGWLSSGYRKEYLERARRCLKAGIKKAREGLQELAEMGRRVCPRCERGYLKFVEYIAPWRLRVCPDSS